MELSTFGCAFLGILVLSPQNSELRLCFGQSPRDLILALTHMCRASVQSNKLVERTKKNKYDRRTEKPTYQRHTSVGPCGGRNGRREQNSRRNMRWRWCTSFHGGTWRRISDRPHLLAPKVEARMPFG